MHGLPLPLYLSVKESHGRVGGNQPAAPLLHPFGIMGLCRKLRKVIGVNPPPKTKQTTISGKEQHSPKRALRRTQEEGNGPPPVKITPSGIPDAEIVPILTNNSSNTKGRSSSSSFWNGGGGGGEVDDTDEAFSNYINNTRTKMSLLPATRKSDHSGRLSEQMGEERGRMMSTQPFIPIGNQSRESGGGGDGDGVKNNNKFSDYIQQSTIRRASSGASMPSSY